MSILNLEATANYISSWIKNYATDAGIKTLVLGLSGGVDSALVALLCKRTNIPLFCVNMPCHSSDSAYTRAANFAKDYDIPLCKIDLSQAHESITAQTNMDLAEVNRIAVGGLRSCLRAPTLSFFANAYSGLIIGTGNRSEDNLTRYFQKYGDGCVDISPISDLFKGEVYELFGFLAVNMSPANESYKDNKQRARSRTMPTSAQAIYDAKPTADLWGPDAGQEDEKELGISYDEIEWADRENMRTEGIASGIVVNTSDPAKHSAWLGYTGRQRIVIAKMHSLEKASRHKINKNLPVCHIRQVEGLVR